MPTDEIVTRESFPPYAMTDAEKAATVGRFVMSPTAVEDPSGQGTHGREEPAPHGVVYVRPGADDTPEDLPPAEPIELGASVPDAATPEPQPDPAAPAAEPEPEPEPEPVAEAEPEVVEEAEEEDVEYVDIDALTVHELHQQLDDLGVEYTSDDRKADLQQKLRKALS